MMKPIEGKTVWITGATSGIGEALVHQMAGHNMRIVLSARREEKLQQVRREADLSEENSLILPLDLEEHHSMKAAVNKVMDKFGALDLMVHNAGISQRSWIKDTEFKVFKRLMDINYLGTISLTQQILPHFIQQQSGHFVVVSSLMGLFSSPRRAGYAASKHALHGFFEALRIEHMKDDIKVTLICPGYVRTNVTKNALTADGSPQGTMDKTTAEGMEPSYVARRIIRAVRKEKNKLVMGNKEVLGYYIKRFFPSLLPYVILNARKTAGIQEAE